MLNILWVIMAPVASVVARIVGTTTNNGQTSLGGGAYVKSALGTYAVLFALGMAIPPARWLFCCSLFTIIAIACVTCAITCFKKTTNGGDVAGSICIIVLIVCFIGFALQKGDKKEEEGSKTQQQASYTSSSVPGENVTVIHVGLGETKQYRASTPYRIKYDGLVAFCPEGQPGCTLLADGEATLVPASDVEAKEAWEDPRAFLERNPTLKHLGGDTIYRKLHPEFSMPVTFTFKAVYRPVKIEVRPW